MNGVIYRAHSFIGPKAVSTVRSIGGYLRFLATLGSSVKWK